MLLKNRIGLNHLKFVCILVEKSYSIVLEKSAGRTNTPGVNFINVFRVRFLNERHIFRTNETQRNKKKTFVQKTRVKNVGEINIKRVSFLYECCFGSFLLVTCT